MKTRKRIEIPPQAVGHLKTIKIIAAAAAAAAPATRIEKCNTKLPILVNQFLQTQHNFTQRFVSNSFFVVVVAAAMHFLFHSSAIIFSNGGILTVDF